MSDFKEFDNPWSADNSEWFGEEMEKWLTGTSNKKQNTVELNSNLTWEELSKNYPASTIMTKDLYEVIGGGLPENLRSNPSSWENSCAIRMSRALNYSGIKLPKAPSNGGNIVGKDKLNYWIRVKDLTKYLVEMLEDRFPLIKEDGGIDAVNSFKGKKGIIVFDVSGWSNATGHFTLWDGANLYYVGVDLRHNDPNSDRYYFSMNYEQGGKTIKTTKIRLWEIS